jgi:hypothetical protein
MRVQWRRFLWRAWRYLLDLALILWIGRASVLSVLAGLVLFLVPQARDTFLEVRGDGIGSPENVVFWVLFFACVIGFWALPVHYAARRTLAADPIFTSAQRMPEDRQKRLKHMRIGFPVFWH